MTCPQYDHCLTRDVLESLIEKGENSKLKYLAVNAKKTLKDLDTTYCQSAYRECKGSTSLSSLWPEAYPAVDMDESESEEGEERGGTQ
jgi:hypothetical protein